MLFSSLTFLFVFFPAVWLLYELTPARAKNLLLLLSSLLFYAWGEPLAVFILLFIVLFVFWIAPFVLKKNRAATFLAFAVPILLLVVGKYLPFFLLKNEIKSAVHTPVGMSFYIFQALSYLSDVRKGNAKIQRNPINLALYLSLFPQLLAGPIVRYNLIENELLCRAPERVRAWERFIFGLSKKCLLANPLGILFSEYSTKDDASFLIALLCIVCFTLHIYFDFSGYSDMAIGIALLFGFHFPENFNYPYTADSLRDFWRRWHITLTDFFRTYVYIPLGGNRRGTRRTVINTVIVWTLTGIWHGVTANFILWGLYWCILLLTEKMIIRDKLTRIPLFFRRVSTLFFVAFGWMLFAFDTPDSRGLYLRALTTLTLDGNAVYECVRQLPLLLVASLFCTPIPYRRFISLKEKNPHTPLFICLPLLLLSTAALLDASYQPFLYFRF